MRLEMVTRRVLGAVRFVDGNTTLPILAPLQVTADSVTLRRNRSGLYVVHPQPPLSQPYRDAFLTQPADPAVNTLTVTITAVDPQNRYLPVTHTITLPRDPDPANADSDTSLFKPIDIALYPTPTAVSQPGWAIVRLTIQDAATNDPIPGAYIRIHDPNDADILLARGLTEWRGRTIGEAFIGVPNIPVTTWNDGDADNVVNITRAVTITAYADPNFPPESSTPPNPAVLEATRATFPSASSNQQLASGQLTVVTIKIPL